MRKFVPIIVLAAMLLVSCGGVAEAPATASTEAPTETPAPLWETAQPPTVELPLAEAGPYEVGVQTLTFVDGSREDRTLDTEIWYPAAIPGGTGLRDARDAGQMRDAEAQARDAEPDDSNAPYPLILYSHWLTGNRTSGSPLLIHLASHGFVVAAADHKCDRQPTCMVDRPLDMLFVLNQLAGDGEGHLEGVIDTDQVGVMGISYGGYTTLVMAGAQTDPDHFLDWYSEESAAGRPALRTLADVWGGDVPEVWDAVEAYRGQFDDLQEGEPWPPITDERIQAALPVVPGIMSNSFGPRGLGAVTMPTMIIAGTADDIVSYEEETVPMYGQLGAEDRYLLSLVDYTHSALETAAGELYFKHFSTAFFGYYLQGREDYADYLTADYVETLDVDDLVWGVYEGE